MQDSPWAALQPLEPAGSAGSNGLRRRCESGPPGGQRPAGGLQQSADEAVPDDDTPSPDEQLPYLESLLLPPVVDEPGLRLVFEVHVKLYALHHATLQVT